MKNSIIKHPIIIIFISITFFACEEKDLNLPQTKHATLISPKIDIKGNNGNLKPNYCKNCGESEDPYYKCNFSNDDCVTMIDEDGYEVWKKAIANITPSVEVRSRRIGGATFQIPTEVRPDRKISLSMKWLIRYSRERNGRTMADKLANEIVAASKGEGAAFKKKEDTHRMAEANKAFSHFKV